ncbi:MAG: transcription-repair coupling factor [Micrococcaceae bacterium]
MRLSLLQQELAKHNVFKNYFEHSHHGVKFKIVPGAVAPAAAYHAQKTTGPLLLVTATTREAEMVHGSLLDFVKEDELQFFPNLETLPHEKISPNSQTIAQRIKVIQQMKSNKTSVIVAPIRAIAQSMPTTLANLGSIELIQGEDFNMDELILRMLDFAYTQVDMVTSRGEFAVRGGIIDIFPPNLEYPVRLDFFGDEVDSIRYFTVSDQRSIPVSEVPELAKLSILPCKEILLDDKVRARAKSYIERFPAAKTMLEKISEGIPVDGMESLLPLLSDEMGYFVDYLPKNSHLVFVEDEKIKNRALDLQRTGEQFLAASWNYADDEQSAPVDIRESLATAHFLSSSELIEYLEQNNLDYCSLNALNTDKEFNFSTPSVQTGNIAEIANQLRQFLKQNTVVVSCQSQGAAARLAESFTEQKVNAQSVTEIKIKEPYIQFIAAEQSNSWSCSATFIVVLTEYDILGKRITKHEQKRKIRRRVKNAVDPLQLSKGDYVVHQQHGVGRFIEMVQRNVGVGVQKAAREYLVIEYAPGRRGRPNDRLFVPADQLDQLSNYVGGENPSLSKMGGSDWAKTKSRARSAVKEIAGELIRLYSARKATKGHAFGSDTPWQQELEDSFPYAETIDQLQSIEEVKRDMESPIPMDRLISGDVGYGKTEVAVRAAFKAVQDGKQVAVLCPTTILVQQHLETFIDRFRGFPIRVASLSRFQTTKQAERTMNDIAAGTVDVIIGTHRLLSKNICFKDLGLVIVDEEQRFGVEHKERLKKMRTNVDVLAMSATPIPRTLEMAVTGIREMSSLATPPEERQPVLTYVGAYSGDQVMAAIQREMMREGQVFYVHNRVKSIEETASKIARLVPEARIAVAHGKMSEKQLEQIIIDFWEQKFDVLVSTTIIETGLDISNANTLIVEHADKYGLSQLHQLRGRVGRSRERAYAYFLYDSERELKETAFERLKAVATHNELGAGMQLAMKDLEIRGAGNLLGAEQSGHIAGVGFDLYLRMVGEAVANYRGEKQEKTRELKIELPVNANIPDSYIDGERLRLEAYKKIAAANKMTELAAVREELEDRYGEMPEPVKMLFNVAQLRLATAQYGVYEIIRMGQRIRFAPMQLTESKEMRAKRLYPEIVIKDGFVLIPMPKASFGKELAGEELLAWCVQVLSALCGE